MSGPYKAANKTERQYDHAVYRTYERFTRNHPRYTGDGLYRYDRNPGKGHPADAGRARYDRQSPHGTGKTVAFGIPILSKVDPASLKPQAVILSPTRELAQQIAQDLQNLAQFLPDIKIVCVYGGAGMDKQQRQLKAGCQIVVATPGRLMDHYRHHAIDVSDVKTVVLDEADEMLNMGFTGTSSTSST